MGKFGSFTTNKVTVKGMGSREYGIEITKLFLWRMAAWHGREKGMYIVHSVKIVDSLEVSLMLTVTSSKKSF